MQYGQISVILPTYNGANFISRAIASVLAQNAVDFELLVIDDGSQDSTGRIVGAFAQRDARIRYLHNGRNIGIQRSLNRGLGEAHGVYIARIDDDDEWILRDKLRKQAAFLDANPECALVGTGVAIVDEAGREIARKILPEKDETIRSRILGRNCFFHSSVLFRKDVATALGGYSDLPDRLHVEDYDLWLRIGSAHKMANLPIFAVEHTIRKEGLSQKNIKVQLRNNLRLFLRYRSRYPSVRSSFFRHLLRLLAYGYLGLPTKTGLSIFA